MASRWRSFQFAIAFFTLACAMPAQQSPQTQPRPTTISNPATPAPPPARPVAGIAGETAAPVAQSSVRFAVIGDTGTGERKQYETATMMARSRQVFPFEFVIMVGDNMYGSERPQDFLRKFEMPYKELLDQKVPFYASLGNHDDPNQRFYKPFNMDGKRYYTFKKQSVRFFALDSNYMDRDQLAWLEKELAASGSDWKIAFFHHPLYSSGGTHGSEVDLRMQLEPIMLKYGVSVVFCGHEHFYERIRPQKGIWHFTSGGGAKLRKGDIKKTNLTAIGYDADQSYVLVEVTGEVMHFQTLNRSGKRIDGGSITRLNPAALTKE